MFDLKDKVALVTGGSRGIGKSIVEKYADAGCKVIFTYHSSDEAAKSIEAEHNAKGQEVFGKKSDASLLKDAEEVVNFVIEKFKRLDFLVNNAGITKDNLLLRMSETDFDSVLDANLKSVFNFSKSVLKPMISQKFGRIINISSVVGITGNPGQSNYVASKAGVIGFSKSIAKEVASRNINVNVIAPGFIETDMTKKLNDKQKEAIFSLIPLKRLGRPEDIANLTLFLSSDYSDYITGQVFAVDGGMTM